MQWLEHRIIPPAGDDRIIPVDKPEEAVDHPGIYAWHITGHTKDQVTPRLQCTCLQPSCRANSPVTIRNDAYMRHLRHACTLCSITGNDQYLIDNLIQCDDET